MSRANERTLYHPVTVIFSWQVLPGKQAEFTNWLHGVSKVASTWPGHMGVTTLRPPNGEGPYHSVLRFDSEQHLKAWLGSAERHRWVNQLNGVAVAHSRTASGLETWFDVPSPLVTPPAKWKMVVVTFIAVYPLSLLLGAFVTPHLIDINIFIRALLFPIVVPAVLTYLFMPFLTQHVFKNWLYKSPKP